MARMKVLITGGNGYIAKSLSKGLNEHELTLITRQDFDLTDRKSTDDWFRGKFFDVIIHTAIKGGSRLKQEEGNDLYQNLQMFYNLYYNSHCFGKCIQFGSGAELNKPNTPYGLSKKIINDLIQPEMGFYNVRIFAVFNEDELDTRFIKSNIKRYINKEEIIIHQNKQMDFFYNKISTAIKKTYMSQLIIRPLTKRLFSIMCPKSPKRGTFHLFCIGYIYPSKKIFKINARKINTHNQVCCTLGIQKK